MTDRQRQFEEFSTAVRAAIEQAKFDLPTLLFMLCGIAARFAIADNMPRSAFLLAARNAFELQEREYAQWRRNQTKC